MSILTLLPLADIYIYQGGGLLLALLLGFVCGSIAGGKGYPSILGFLLGFFLPIIGLIICLVMPRRHG